MSLRASGHRGPRSCRALRSRQPSVRPTRLPRPYALFLSSLLHRVPFVITCGFTTHSTVGAQFVVAMTPRMQDDHSVHGGRVFVGPPKTMLVSPQSVVREPCHGHRERQRELFRHTDIVEGIGDVTMEILPDYAGPRL